MHICDTLQKTQSGSRAGSRGNPGPLGPTLDIFIIHPFGATGGGVGESPPPEPDSGPTLFSSKVSPFVSALCSTWKIHIRVVSVGIVCRCKSIQKRLVPFLIRPPCTKNLWLTTYPETSGLRVPLVDPVQGGLRSVGTGASLSWNSGCSMQSGLTHETDG